MTYRELINELEFVTARAIWLRRQPCDEEGALLCQDYREESGMLLRRVEELQRICESL